MGSWLSLSLSVPWSSLSSCSFSSLPAVSSTALALGARPERGPSAHCSRVEQSSASDALLLASLLRVGDPPPPLAHGVDAVVRQSLTGSVHDINSFSQKQRYVTAASKETILMLLGLEARVRGVIFTVLASTRLVVFPWDHPRRVWRTASLSSLPTLGGASRARWRATPAQAPSGPPALSAEDPLGA